MIPKELSNFLTMFGNEQGIARDQVLDLVLDAFSAYASKIQSSGEGKFVTRFEDGAFVSFRVWELVPNDVVMENPQLQWRVLDAEDEGFDGAEAGDEVQVEVEPVELTRTFKTWMYQFMLRKMRQ